VAADFGLPGASDAHTSSRPATLRILTAQADEIPEPDSEPRYLRRVLAFDGFGYAMLQGLGGDVLFQYGDHARFHLSADLGGLRCSAIGGEDAVWQRVLLDTVLCAVSLLHGYEHLHASAVETKSGLFAFIASRGGGKSSLAAEFLRRGGNLFADDVLALDDSGGEVVAHPGPRLMNLPAAFDPCMLGDAVPLHKFPDETWLTIPTSPPLPQPLSAAILIHRYPNAPLECHAVPATSLTLLPHMRFLPYQHDRARRRFTFASGLAEQTPVLSLTANPAVPPAELADLVEKTVDNL
jgi:hypothetical protein